MKIKNIFTIKIFKEEDKNNILVEKKFENKLEEFREVSYKYLQALKPGEIVQLQHYKETGEFGWDFIIEIKCILDKDENKRYLVSLNKYDEIEINFDGKTYKFKHIEK